MAKKITKLTSPVQVKDRIIQLIAGLEWVEEHGALHKTYYRVNKDGRIEALTFDGLGIKLHWRNDFNPLRGSGMIMPAGRFEAIKNQTGRFVKGILEGKTATE